MYKWENRKIKKSGKFIRRTFNHYQTIYHWIDSLTDTRNKFYITYDVKVCILTRILAFFGIQFMNQINRDFNTNETVQNINNILNENYVDFPYKGIFTNVINFIKFEELENIQTLMIKN